MYDQQATSHSNTVYKHLRRWKLRANSDYKISKPAAAARYDNRRAHPSHRSGNSISQKLKSHIQRWIDRRHQTSSTYSWYPEEQCIEN